ncbi:MAG: FHA domain-containing protein [Planctomycetota bacterium]
MIRIAVTNPEGDDFVVDVDGDSAVVGRSPDADVAIPNPLVSARHLRIDAGAVVRDLRSKNGSWMRGARMHGPVLIGEGGVVLGPDPDRSPTLRIELVTDENGREPGLDATLPSGERAGSLRRVDDDASTTVIHPVVQAVAASSATNGALSNARAFVVDACLQSIWKLESRLSLHEDAVGDSRTKDAPSAGVFAAVESVLRDVDDVRARQKLLEALSEQRHRAVAGYESQRRAAVALVEELRDELADEKRLVGYGGVPAWKKLLGLRPRILWTRVRDRLASLDRRRIEARLDQLVREQPDSSD